MDGFTGFKTATTEEMPHAAAAMDPFHVVRLAGDALDRCRRRASRTPTDTEAARATRSKPPGGPCIPALTCSPTNRRTDSPHFRCRSTCRGRSNLGHLPADDRRLPRIRPGYGPRVDERLGQPRRRASADGDHHAGSDAEASGRRVAYFRPPRHVQRADWGLQRPTRTPPRLRSRVPQLDELHRQAHLHPES